jgi:SAM-dependent methyltransferase
MRAERIRAHYERRIEPRLKSHEILDWSSPEAQRRRFEVLCRVLDAEFQTGRMPASGPLLLDVGCGLTDLKCYLDERGVRVRYVGVDLSQRMLREAQRRHPGRCVVQADVFAAAPFAPRTFDVAFCSGTLNLRLDNNAADARLRGRQLPACAGGGQVR